MLHVNHALPVLTITDNHGWAAAGNARSGLHSNAVAGNARSELHSSATADLTEGAATRETREDVPYVVEHHVTRETSTADSATPGGVTAQDAQERLDHSLPSLAPPERFGASTSYGFSAQDPSGNRGAAGKRATHTAMMYRELVGTGGHALPNIHAASASGDPVSVGKVVLRMDSDKNGLTRMLHTFHPPNGWVGGGGGGGRGGGRGGGGGSGVKGKGKGKAAKESGRTTEDERYRRLERLLVRIEPPNEGYLELSPSFHCPRQAMTFTRPSSFHSSSFRSRRSSSPPSISPVPLVISSL